MPQSRFKDWLAERDLWLREHPEPHDVATRREFAIRFTRRIQDWLDAGYGSCVLEIPEVKVLMEGALCHFDGQRYQLHSFAVASNHVHALVTPGGDNTLSQILHSWKSFTSHAILKVEAASRRLRSSQEHHPHVRVWQKESFDHIVRNAASMERFIEYIRAHER